VCIEYGYADILLDKASHVIKHLADNLSVRADNGDSERGSLPEVLMIDFRDRYVESAFDSVAQAPYGVPLILERRTAGNDQIDP